MGVIFRKGAACSGKIVSVPSVDGPSGLKYAATRIVANLGDESARRATESSLGTRVPNRARRCASRGRVRAAAGSVAPDGALTAIQCYAWEVDGKMTAVLRQGPVDSPLAAVRASILAERETASS